MSQDFCFCRFQSSGKEGIRELKLESFHDETSVREPEPEDTSALAFLSQIDKITADLDKIDLGIISASSLTKPKSPPPPPPKKAEPESPETSFSSFLRDSTVNVDLDDEEEEDDLPEGWKSIMSSTGKVYFYNEECGSTQWTRPEDDIGRTSEAYAVL